MSAFGYKWIYKSHPESVRFHQERRSRHDQSEGPPTSKGESGAECQKARSQRRPTRPKNPAGAVRSGTRFDKKPARECQHQELRRGETGGAAVEIGRAVEHPSQSPCRFERGQLSSAASNTLATWSASRPVPWRICWRQLVPPATTSASSAAARIVGSRSSSAIFMESA